MKSKYCLIAAWMLASAYTISAMAQPAGNNSAAPSLSQSERNEILQTLNTKLKANYVFPDVALRITKALADKSSKGGYATVQTAPALAEALSKDLREFGDDKHFRIFVDPRFSEDNSPSAVPSAEEINEQRAETVRRSYGIEKLQVLPGNVGYLELRGFGPTEFVGAAYTSAMSLLAGTDALILDLRRNGGGNPTSVAYLMSHFFALGDERHLNDIYTRTDNTTQQSWTSRSVTERYIKPVYVLISPRTFSGGEECAYDFQTQKRGTLVGETTGGGANPVDRFSLGNGLVASIPTGRAVNPITKTNWEHVGVKPDIPVPAADAQQTAYVAILRTLVAKSSDPRDRDFLQKTLNLAEKGESEMPVYKMRQ